MLSTYQVCKFAILAATMGPILSGCDTGPTPEDTATPIHNSDRALAILSPSDVFVSWRWKSHYRRRFEIDADLAAMAREAMPATNLHVPAEIPFVRFQVPHATYSLEFNPVTLRSALLRSDGESIRIDLPGVPVGITMLDDDRVAVFIRGIPRNRLTLAVFTRQGRMLSKAPLGPEQDVDYMFRASIRVGDRLFAVLYDNKNRQNRLSEWRIGDVALQPSARTLSLPTLEVPAGGNYEMEPPVFLHADESRLWITAGTLHAEIVEMQLQGIQRLDQCIRTLEAVRGHRGVSALCEAKHRTSEAVAPFRIWNGTEGFGDRWKDIDAIPWALMTSGAEGPKWAVPQSAAELRLMFISDLARAQNSGVLDFGVDNIEGRVPWGQAYYLWGFMDLLYLASRDRVAFDLFAPIIPAIKRRLDVEIHLIDRLLGSKLGIASRGFTVDRSPALFAVQTGRLVVLIERYLREIPNPIALRNYERFRDGMLHLRNHIDVLATRGESDRWIPPGRHHLRWPKGSAFFFDGAPVPFNHQNEWAYGVFEAARGGALALGSRPLRTANDVIEHFLRRVAPDGRLPLSGDWDYWWGRAHDGWTTADQVSVNRPEYVGDKGKAWISFKTIDVMSVLGAGNYVSRERIAAFGQSALDLVERGKIYPFAAYSLAAIDVYPAPPFATAASYARVGAPWDIGSAVWALFWLANMMEGPTEGERSASRVK